MTVVCPVCDTEHDAGAWRCQECGKLLDDVEDTDAGTSEHPLRTDGGVVDE